MTKWRKWRLQSKQDRCVWKCKHQHSQCGGFICVSPDCYPSLSDLGSLLFLFMSSSLQYKFTYKILLFLYIANPFFYWSYDVEMYPYSFWGENGHITMRYIHSNIKVRRPTSGQVSLLFFYSNAQEIGFAAEIRVGQFLTILTNVLSEDKCGQQHDDRCSQAEGTENRTH